MKTSAKRVANQKKTSNPKVATIVVNALLGILCVMISYYFLKKMNNDLIIKYCIMLNEASYPIPGYSNNISSCPIDVETELRHIFSFIEVVFLLLIFAVYLLELRKAVKVY